MKRLINYEDRDNKKNKGLWVCGAKLDGYNLIKEKVFKKLLKITLKKMNRFRVYKIRL